MGDTTWKKPWIYVSWFGTPPRLIGNKAPRLFHLDQSLEPQDDSADSEKWWFPPKPMEVELMAKKHHLPSREPRLDHYILEDVKLPGRCKRIRGTVGSPPPFFSHEKPIWKGNNPILRGGKRSPCLLNHLLNGMILQAGNDHISHQTVKTGKSSTQKCRRLGAYTVIQYISSLEASHACYP